MDTKEKEERLIDLVKLHPCLFDKSHPNYKNKTIRESKWKEIGAELKEPAALVLKKWTSIRTQFMAHLRKLKMPSGAEGGNRPFFRHEQALRFLKDAPELNESTLSNLNIDRESGGPKIYSQINENSTVFVNDDLPIFDPIELENEGITNSGSQVTSNSADFPRTPLVPRNKEPSTFRSHKRKEMTTFEKEALKKMDSIGKDCEDEFELYGKMFAPKLRKLSEKNRREFLQLQHSINGLVHEAELYTLD